MCLIFFTCIIKINHKIIKKIPVGTEKNIGKITTINPQIKNNIQKNILINKGSLIFSLKNLNKWYSIKNTNIKVMKI